MRFTDCGELDCGYRPGGVNGARKFISPAEAGGTAAPIVVDAASRKPAEKTAIARWLLNGSSEYPASDSTFRRRLVDLLEFVWLTDVDRKLLTAGSLSEVEHPQFVVREVLFLEVLFPEVLFPEVVFTEVVLLRFVLPNEDNKPNQSLVIGPEFPPGGISCLRVVRIPESEESDATVRRS